MKNILIYKILLFYKEKYKELFSFAFMFEKKYNFFSGIASYFPKYNKFSELEARMFHFF